MTMTSSEPFADAPAAALDGDGENVYVLVGTLVEQKQDGSQPTYHLVAGDRIGPELDEPLISVLKWFNTARTESQVREFLRWADAPAGVLDDLVASRLIAKADGRGAWKAARSLRGFRLVPTSYLDPDTRVTPGLVAVKRTPESRRDTAVTAELADVLWGDSAGQSIPAAILSLVKRLGANRETVARFVLSDVAMLIDFGFAQLAPVDA